MTQDDTNLHQQKIEGCMLMHCRACNYLVITKFNGLIQLSCYSTLYLKKILLLQKEKWCVLFRVHVVFSEGIIEINQQFPLGISLSSHQLVAHKLSVLKQQLICYVSAESNCLIKVTLSTVFFFFIMILNLKQLGLKRLTAC